MPVKLPPGAVAVEDSPNLPPGAVAVQDETSTAPPAPYSSGNLRPLTQKERFMTDYPVGRPGQSVGSNIYNTAQNVGVGMFKFLNSPIKTTEDFVSSLIPQPIADYATQHGKAGELRKKQASGQTLTPDEQKYLDRENQLVGAPNQVQGIYDIANTRDVPAAAQGVGQAIVLSGAGDLISGGRGLAPRTTRAAAADKQASALSSVLARTPLPGDKEFIPQQVAADTVQHIRQAAADNPAIAKVATKGNALESFGATRSLIDKAIDSKEREFDAKVAPALNQPVDAQPALNHLYASDALRIAFPDQAEFVDSFYNRLERVQNLKQLNDLRKLLNETAEATYKDIRPDEYGKIGAYRDAADALRNLFYDEVQRHTGEDLRPVKRTEGALLDAKYAIKASTNRLTSEHQKFVEPNTPRRLVAKVIEGVAPDGGFKIPVAGYVADRMRGSSLDLVQDYWKKALSDLPPPTPAKGPAPVAPVPPNRPKLGPGGPGSAMQTAPPGPVPGQPPPSSVSYPNPAGVGAPAPVPQMGTTPGYQLPSGPAAYAGPNTVNPSTARTQVAPTLAERTAVPPVAPPPGTGLVLGPDGTVTIPRKMLAAPAKVGDIINFQGKKMQVAKVFKDGQTALKEVTPPKAPKGKKGNGPVAAIEPYKSPAQMTDEWSNPNQA